MIHQVYTEEHQAIDGHSEVCPRSRTLKPVGDETGRDHDQRRASESSERSHLRVEGEIVNLPVPSKYAQRFGPAARPLTTLSIDVSLISPFPLPRCGFIRVCGPDGFLGVNSGQ